jgi:hypothetical protein
MKQMSKDSILLFLVVGSTVEIGVSFLKVRRAAGPAVPQVITPQNVESDLTAVLAVLVSYVTKLMVTVYQVYHYKCASLAQLLQIQYHSTGAASGETHTSSSSYAY